VLAALRVLRRAIGQFEHYGWLYVIANLMSIALSLPLFTAVAAYAALSHLSHTAQTTQTATYSDFWAGFRTHLGRGIAIAAANVVILGMLWSNFVYYGSQTGALFVALRTMWLIILIVWLAIQVYLWPILEEMEQPNLRGAIRNAAVMMLQNPIFTVSLLGVMAVIALVSAALVIPWLLVTSSILACTANAAVIDRLDIVRGQREEHR
jgi:uncharacterized membrane protein YesL